MFIHTIEVRGTTPDRARIETRSSLSRHYLACLVGTITAASLVQQAARLADVEAAIPVNDAEVVRLGALLRMTEQEAMVAYKAEELLRWGDLSKGIQASPAHRSLDCYRPEGPFALITAIGQAKHLRKVRDEWKAHVLGAQYVISWHGSTANASRARDAYRGAAGDRLEIRTDITVRETVKRTKKPAAV